MSMSFILYHNFLYISTKNMVYRRGFLNRP
nr:MAG TPA: Progressive rod-cone degeneration [Caudoviricetes sp.]